MVRLHKLPAWFVTFARRLRTASRNLWTRVILISILSLLAVVVAKLLGRFIPQGFAQSVGADSVTSLLTIIANAMLAVTTFSLSVMVTIHRSVSNQWTPRAHHMMLRDTTTQTILATFVGAYIYALTSLILLSTPFFGEAEVVVLFGVTLLVIALIVAMILRWIMHLQTWGSLQETARVIEDAARTALRQRADRPCQGCNALTDRTVIAQDASSLIAPQTGYIQEILLEKVAVVAETANAQVYLIVSIGSFVHKGDVIGHVSTNDPRLCKQITEWVSIAPMRTPEQDPRFCLLMLAEIGSKALSPGINDPGTAIDIIGRLARLLEGYTPEQTTDKSPDYVNIWMPVIDPTDIVVDAFAAIARDGAHQAEVQIVLQKRLKGIARHAEPVLADALMAFAKDSLENANDAIQGASDRARLAKAFKAG